MNERNPDLEAFIVKQTLSEIGEENNTIYSIHTEFKEYKGKLKK